MHNAVDVVHAQVETAEQCRQLQSQDGAREQHAHGQARTAVYKVQRIKFTADTSAVAQIGMNPDRAFRVQI